MEGTSTFTDGACNQKNLTKISNSEARRDTTSFAQDLFNKVKQLFVQQGIIEPEVDVILTEESGNHKLSQTVSNRNVAIEEVISDVVIQKYLYSSQLNYQLNIQKMNLFTYLKRAINSSEQSFSGQFLKQFKTFLSVIVGAAPDNNAPLSSSKRAFGILSNLGGLNLLSNKIFNHPAMRSWASVLFLTLLTAFGTLAQTGITTPQPDVSVKKAISTQSPTIGQDVTYTVKVRNDGAIKATGVELTDIMPTGVTFKSVSVGGVGTTTNSTTAGVTTVVWNIGDVPATATDLTMTIVATVISRGLHFNTAEITKEVELDLDSTPNNNKVGEDDQDAVCFSIEEYFYKGDEFTITLPTGYTNINWTKKVGGGNAVAITSTTPGVILSADKNSIVVTDITAYTEFAFTASEKNCPVNGCCPAKFIYGPIGSIGDYVFTDVNKDGVQDAGDTKLPGIKVQLYKADGVTFLEEVITDVNGKYLFDSLETGSYKVKFILPSGSTFSPTGAGTTATDSDAGLNGFSGIINIDVEGTGIVKDNPTIDAGLVGNLGSIGDFVFRDDNSNGIQDLTEPGIAGVVVNLYKGTTLLTSTTTDVNGKYNFPNLSSGTDYRIIVTAPVQSKFTKADAGNNLGGNDLKDSDVDFGGTSHFITIDVTKATTDTLRNNPNIDAGIIPLGSIGDYVFNDNNGNGIQDAGDTKLVGIKVTLTDKDGNILTSTTTDADGKYEFIVPSGEYFVIFDKPTGSTFSPTGASTISTDSDADATGKSGKITIDASKPVGDPARNNTTVDAGLIPNKGTIGDFVFVDADGDNKQDAGEVGLAGVTVELYDATGTTKLQTTTTDVTGKYLFSGLESGGYKVKFILPSGKTFVTSNVGTSTEDSDAGVGGFSGVINIDVTKPLGDIGRNNLTIDAGVKADCIVNAGTLATTIPNLCLPDAGSVVLTATVSTAPTVPTGYSVKYVLTKGTDLVIQQVANTPTFTVSATGEYRIHTLVYDGNSANGSFLDLSTIILGTTKAGDVIASINQRSLCAALDATGVNFNVNPTPIAPVFAGKTICAGETAKIGLDGPIVLEISYTWFTSATATTPFATTQSIDVTPAVTTTYYVETTLVTPNACPSKRGSVTVTVNPKPENPVAKSSLDNDCTKNLQTVNLADAITTIPAGSTIEWHVANNPTSAIVTNTTTVGAGTYYVFAKSTAGCYSGGFGVTVNITPCNCQNPATVSVSPIASVCGNTSAIIQLGATIGGGATSGIWTSNGTGTYDNATSLTAKYTPSAADVIAGSVEFTFTTNDPDGADPKCNAVLAKTTLTFKVKPAAPVNLRCEPVICLGDGNKLFSVSQGNVVKWYATATSIASLGTATDDGFVITPTSEGTFTYYAEATTPEGCVSERSSISFIVKKCLTDLAVIKKAYMPDAITTPDYLLGQTATYSIEAQNIGDANATDVKVTDILPAGATYISSTPLGEYNSTTGVWTIGSLTKGSNKSLLIQVTLGQKGSVVNTATISGTNEDPTKLDNNTSTVTIKVVDIADLSLTKTVNKSIVNIGDEIEYTITVLNSGPNTATNVEVKDKLPVGLTYVSSSTLTESAGVLTGTAASIAKGASAVFTFKAKVATEGKITNLAEVSKSDQKDPDSIPNNASTKPDEDDDDAVDIISTSVCNIEKPIIACVCTQKTICLGGEATLTATGCIGSTFVWSNGGTTSSITVSPKTNQTYTVYCQKDNCKSEQSNAVEVKVITVDSPLLSASTSKICAGESTTLIAAGCGGVVEWQTSPKQTGPQITVSPIVSETYKAVCKEFECVSALASVDVIVTPTPKAPIIVCEKAEICPGETITITAMNCNGQVKWSTGQETTTITVFPTITSTYTVTCSVNGCTSGESKPFVVTVKPVIVPIIKTTDLTVCTGGSATLTAEGCTGKVTWYYGDKTLTGATIIVKPIATTIYYATCSTISCISDKSSPVTVQVVNPSPPIVSSGTSTICAGSSVELTSIGCEGGTVTWSDGQKGAVVTVKPLVSTSYTATCSIGTCVSANSIKRDITVTEFAKTIITADKLAICAGNSVTLTANGCNGNVKWSDGITGSPRTVTPTADVKYTATCESTTCKSDVSNELDIKVNVSGQAPVISCPKTEICAGESITLSAVGCTGTVKWSDGSTGTTVTVRPSTTTTYSATCTINTCESPKSNEKIITVNPAVVLNLIASASSPRICAGAETTLTLAGCAGTITWTGGLTGASIKVKPTETTDYTATCSGVACATDASASVKVTVLPGVTTPNITPTNTQICAGAEVTLTANNCNGALLWSNGATTASITVKPTVTTIYSVKCTVDGCGEAKTSEPVTVKVGTPDAPTITSGISTICAGSSVELTAIGCEDGTVTWSDGQKGAVVTVKPLVSTSYTATCSIGTCVSANSIKRDITVTEFAKTIITADKLAICAGNSVTLTANGCNGNVKWSDGITGSPRTVTPTADVKYTATCESTTCKSDVSNELDIKVNVSGQAPVISCPKTEICAGESITLSAVGCTGTVKWSDGSTGTTVTVRPSTTTTYSATCTINTCESPKSNEKIITVNPAVVLNLIASASSPRICAGAETTLTLAGCAGTITWTGGLTGASIKVKPTETTDYTATCSGVACATDASASVKVTVLPGVTTPNITPTNTQICAGAEVTLTANNCNGALLWSNGATTASITVKPTVTTIYSVKCTVDGCGEAKTSEPVTVKVGTPDAPTITSVPLSVCSGGTVVLTAVGCSAGTVVWSNGKTGATLTETVNSTTTYSAVCKQGTCSSPESNKVTVTVTIPSVPTISCATSTICAGSTITLVATGCEGTVKWSDGQTGAIVTATPTRTTDYTATCTIGTCTSSPSSVATVNVGNPPAPSITCNATSICQGVQITLTATNCTGTIVWNDGQVGNVITAKPNATTKYTAICKLDKCESGTSNEITITVGAGIKTPTTMNLNNVCPFLTVDLASGVTSTLSAGGSFEYHTGVLPTSPLVSNPNAVGTGTYYVFEKTGTGCYSSPGVINTFINTDCTPKDCAKNPVTASAGADATICAEKTYKLSGTFGGAATSIVWKTTGSGSFDNPLSTTATYRSSLADVLAGTVKLIICTNDPDGSGPCKATADTMVLTMNGVKFKPTVAVSGNLNSCGTDSVTLSATAGYAYMWFKVGTITPIATTRSITVKSSGGYFFKLVDANKCCSIESDTATVNYLVAPNAPIANNVKIDRGTTIDLNKLVVSNLPAGATLVFKIGESIASTTVANPSAVGAGTYYACYRNAQGCFSLPTKITVENKDDGTTPSTVSDIQITVTTENNIALDSTVKVIITVRNNGPVTGKNVIVSSAISGGLTYVNSTGGLVKTGNLLNGTLDSLISGGVKVYTWVGKIIGTTTSVTVGATATSTTTDSNLNNNNASNPNGSTVVSVPSPNSSDIVVTITTDKTTYVVGDTVTTTIKITNLGPAMAKNVTVSSTVPDLLRYVSQTGGLVINGKVLTGKVDSLLRDGIVTYIYKSVLTGTGPVVITGTGTSNNPDPNPNNNNGTGTNGSVTINSVVVQGADVVITVKTDKTTYVVGDVVTTTVKVTNLGPDVAKNINVFSVIPGTLTYIGQTGGLVKTGNLLTAIIESLDKDGTVTYTYTATLNTKSETVVAAGGISTTKDPNLNNNNGTGTGTTSINVGDVDPTVADVAVVITADKTKAKVGEDVSFILTLTNNGPATATEVVLVNPIPAGMTFVSSSTGQVLTSGAISVNLASMEKGQVRTYAYVAKMNVKTDVTNTVSVGSFKDNVGPNNFSFVTINGDTTGVPLPKDEAELALLLTADKQLIAKDDVVTFTIKVTNNGPKVATNVVVDNILPKFLTFQSGDPSQKGDTLRVATASIPVGASVTYTYKAKVNKDTIISNTARITKTSPVDPILTNNVSTVVLVPATDTTYADLSVLIAADKATYKVGDNVTYTVTLTNNGVGRAEDVQLCNPIPSGLTYVSGGTGVIKAVDSVTIKVDTISKGKTRIFTYITKAATAGTFANTVRICNSSKPDLITPNNTSTSTITVTRPDTATTCKIDLAMAILDTAKVSTGVYDVTYRLIAKNVCKDTLKNVTFYNDLAKTFKTPVTCEIRTKPTVDASTNLVANDLFSKTDSSIVKTGGYMLPNATDTIRYVIRVTLNGNKGPFVSNATMAGKTTANENLTAKASEALRFDLPNTRFGLAKEIVTTGLKNDSTTYWTVPYRIRVVNLGANAIAELSVKDNLDAVFTAKGAIIIGKPIVIATPGLTVNKKYTGRGAFTDLLEPDSSTVAKGETGTIDLTVRVNVDNAPDVDKIFNNVAIGVGKGADSLSYRDVSTNGNNPDTNGDKDPTNDNVATPVQLKGTPPPLQVSIGIALAAVRDTIPLADSTCNVTLIMTAKNYGRDALRNVRLCTNIDSTIGKQAESWKLVGSPRVIRGNAKISTTFNGKRDSTITKSDSSFIAVGDSIVIAYMINIKKPLKDTIYTQAFAKARSAVDTLKLTSDISMNGLKPDINGDGSPDEAAPTPIVCKDAVNNTTAFIPRGFSPNGDGVNDAFKIGGMKDTELNELIIFNRWGGVVFASGDYKNDWIGQSNQGVVAIGAGQGLPDGTYYYCFTRYNKNTDGTKGDKIAPEQMKSITLIR